MLAQEIIAKKRDGKVLTDTDISGLVKALSDGSLADSQAAAFAMAVYLRGMSDDETVALTLAMRDSGSVLSWEDTGKPIADKHSTGGIGDNVSLMLAPIAAACGLTVPMISGRGLGPTGGTLDKLESIPSYNVSPSQSALKAIVRETGCAIVGQTGDLAPADKRLYAIRDVTATVESMPLIVSSILSKKLAAGLQTLVLDVKAGGGAFMANTDDAIALAKKLVSVANGAGLPATALVTDMNEPLADAVGNAVEIENALAFLKGEKSGTRLQAVVLALAGEMLMGSDIAQSPEEAQIKAEAALTSGAALSCFARMVAGLGGPSDFVEKTERYLPVAPVVRPVPSGQSGFLSACDARAIGLSALTLGGGRKHPDDQIDHSVGFSGLRPLGSPIEVGEPIGFVHARDEASADIATDALQSAYRIDEAQRTVPSLIVARLTGDQ